MRLREALAASNCCKVKNTETNYVYEYLMEINNVCYVHAERDIWEPVIEKKLVKKQLEAWVNIYNTTATAVHATHMSKEIADNSATPNRIACVKLTGTYEIEEI